MRKELLEHGDAALSIGARSRHPAVDGQRGEEGNQDQNEGGNGREDPRREKGDAWLISESGEVVHAREAHNAPTK